MLRVWMLLVVGAAAMRQVAEDVSADSAVKGELDLDWERDEEGNLYLPEEDWDEDLRSAVEEVAKKNFPEEDLYRLTKKVMTAEAFGELGLEDIEGLSQEAKKKQLLKAMQQLRELPVAASAVKFCSLLFRAANSEYGMDVDEEPARYRSHKGQIGVRTRAEKAAKICHKVLTGELGSGEPKWAEKAAKSSQPDGQHLKLGRLEHVDAMEPAWKVSLDHVCRDECHALVEEMREEANLILNDLEIEKPPSYEEVCAKRVVQKVEAEILGCCAEKCGWNGRACMLWPFLSREEKGQWEAECCTEFNILKGSSRATMCDATLTRKENNEVIRDGQPNTEEEREMIGQDPVLKGTSFLQGEGTNGPSHPPENTPIPRYEGTCPDPLKLGKEISKLKGEWKTTSQFSKWEFQNFPACAKQPTIMNTIGTCTAFLPQGVDGGYVCYGECLKSVPVDDLPKLQPINAETPGNTGLLYVHETIYNR